MDLMPETIERGRRKAYDAVNRTRVKLGLEPLLFSNDPEPFYCSFCGKVHEEIQSMVGGVGAYICNECIRKSFALIHENDE